MKITDCRVIVCSPGRNFVTLKIETDEGVHGLGDATLNGRELAVILPLIACIVWLGVYPKPVLRRMETAATKFVTQVNARRQRLETADAGRNGQ